MPQKLVDTKDLKLALWRPVESGRGHHTKMNNHLLFLIKSKIFIYKKRLERFTKKN